MKRITLITIPLVFPIVLIGSQDRAVRPDEIAQLQDELGHEVVDELPDLADYTAVTDLDEPPIPVNYEPTFPKPKQESWWQSWWRRDRWTEVEVLVLVNELGKVDDVVVLKSDFSKVSDWLVVHLVDWEFNPPTIGGKPVKCFLKMPVRMTIEGFLRDQNNPVQETSAKVADPDL